MASENAEDDSSKDANCSPLELAMNAMLGRLSGMHSLMFPERDPGSFITNFLEPHMRSEKSAKEMRNWMIESENLKHCTAGKSIKASGQEVGNRLVAYFTACGFYVKALHSRERRTADEAWEHLAEANYFYGVLHGRISVFPSYRLSSAGGDARHSETNEIKTFVFEWLTSNRSNYPAKSKTDSGKSRAAAAIVKLQPITQRTALRYVDEWEALQSAGTL